MFSLCSGKSISYLLAAILVVVVFSLGVLSWWGLSRAPEEGTKELTIFNWKDYIGSDTIANFEKEFDVKVNYLTFDDDEEVISALQSAPSDYDLIVVSSDLVTDLANARMLAKIDHGRIPNIRYLGKEFVDPSYDPGNRYGIPYLWGTTGIIVNEKLVKGDPDSWKVLWDPSYKGRIAMLNSIYALLIPPLLMMDSSINTHDIELLDKAGKMLIEQRPLVAGYMETTDIRDRMVTEEIWLAQIYNGEAMQAVERNDALRYFIPREGAEIWIDNWVISAGSRNVATAEQFLNFIMRPEVNASIADELWFATCNAAAESFMDKEILSDPAVYPPKGVLKKLQIYEDVGSPEETAKTEAKSNEIWVELTGDSGVD